MKILTKGIVVNIANKFIFALHLGKGVLFVIFLNSLRTIFSPDSISSQFVEARILKSDALLRCTTCNASGGVKEYVEISSYAAGAKIEPFYESGMEEV